MEVIILDGGQPEWSTGNSWDVTLTPGTNDLEVQIDGNFGAVFFSFVAGQDMSGLETLVFDVNPDPAALTQLEVEAYSNSILTETYGSTTLSAHADSIGGGWYHVTIDPSADLGITGDLYGLTVQDLTGNNGHTWLLRDMSLQGDAIIGTASASGAGTASAQGFVTLPVPFVQSALTVEDTSGTAITVTLGAQPAQGNLLVAFLKTRHSDVEAENITAPQGWELVLARNDRQSLSVWRKVAGANEDTQHTFTFPLSHYRIASIGEYTGVTVTMNVGATDSSASSFVNPPRTITPPATDEPECLLLAAFAFDRLSAEAQNFTLSSPWHLREADGVFVGGTQEITLWWGDQYVDATGVYAVTGDHDAPAAGNWNGIFVALEAGEITTLSGSASASGVSTAHAAGVGKRTGSASASGDGTAAVSDGVLTLLGSAASSGVGQALVTGMPLAVHGVARAIAFGRMHLASTNVIAWGSAAASGEGGTAAAGVRIVLGSAAASGAGTSGVLVSAILAPPLRASGVGRLRAVPVVHHFPAFVLGGVFTRETAQAGLFDRETSLGGVSQRGHS